MKRLNRGIVVAFILANCVALAQESEDTTTQPAIESDSGQAGGQREVDPIIENTNAILDGAARRASETGPGAGGADGPGVGTTGYYLRVVAAVCVVVALILVLGYLMRRFGRNTPLLAGPDLAKTLGRVYLTKGATLHFVQTAGRVLVIGVTNQNVSLVAEFDATGFRGERGEGAEQAGAFNPDAFLAHLRESSRTMSEAVQGEQDEADDDIAALRGDIQRLQQYLREETREPQD